MSEIIDLRPIRSDRLFIAWLELKGWDVAKMSDQQIRGVFPAYEIDARSGIAVDLKLFGVPGGLGALRERGRQ